MGRGVGRGVAVAVGSAAEWRWAVGSAAEWRWAVGSAAEWRWAVGSAAEWRWVEEPGAWAMMLAVRALLWNQGLE